MGPGIDSRHDKTSFCLHNNPHFSHKTGFTTSPGFVLSLWQAPYQRLFLLVMLQNAPMHYCTTMIISVLLAGNLQAQYYGVRSEASHAPSLGLTLGASAVRGDVAMSLPGSFELGLTAQKPLGRAFDFRVQLFSGRSLGIDTEASSGIRFNTALNGECTGCQPFVAYDTVNARVFHNFMMRYHNLSFQIKINFNRLFSAEGGENWEIYAFGGLGTMLYFSRMDALDASNQVYDYSGISGDDPIEIRNALASLRDGTFESKAYQDYLSKNGIGNFAFSTLYSTGAGLRMKTGEKTAVGLELRYHFTRDDLLDGQQWDNNNRLTGDTDRLVGAGMNFSYLLGKK